MKVEITDDEIMRADHIDANMAAAYLGIGAQGCRALARSGRIGEPVAGTNRVMFQSRKLIAFKRGENADNTRYEVVARILQEEGVTEIATKIAVAILQIVDETANQNQKRG